MEEHAIVIADPSGVIRFWSGGAETAFGHTADEAVGRTLDLIIPAEHREAHWNGFRRAIASGEASVEVRPFRSRGAAPPARSSSGRAGSPWSIGRTAM